MRGGHTRNYNQAYADCMHEWGKYTKHNPKFAAAITQNIGGTDGVINTCAKRCSKITQGKSYKDKCQMKTSCAVTGSNNG
jgi:hypothetical protein